MAITKTLENDRIEVINKFHVQIRTATIIKEDDVEISRSFHRRVLEPGTLDASDNLVETDLSKEDADNFICNSIEIRKRIVSPVFNCDKVFGIGRHRFCDMSEFKKSGGAVKCLTLKL